MIKSLQKLLITFGTAIILMIMLAVPVFASDDESEISNFFDPTTTVGSLAVIGTGGVGAVAVTRNNKKRKERLAKNHQLVDVNKTYTDKTVTSAIETKN